MPRRVFFSFHYDEDIWRVSQIRKSRMTRSWETNDFLDKASWESVKRKGDDAVMSWIDREISGTGVTVVLIGAHTAERRFVRYEIEQSYKRGNGLLGIHIHGMKDNKLRTTRKGRNPLNDVTIQVGQTFLFFNWTEKKRLSDIFPTYDWVQDDGYTNIGNWIEDAARRAGR